MTLGEKQRLFTRLVAQLIHYAYASGFELTFGEVLRRPAVAVANAAAGTGIANSLHRLSLAVDFNLFKSGVYLTDSETHRSLGDYWKTLDPLCRWGGDFASKDGNHYSIEHEGVR